MNRNITRNEKHKYSNEEKLALGEDKNKSALVNIAQENNSNIFELLENFLFIVLVHNQQYVKTVKKLKLA